MKSRRIKQWNRLDNAAKIFPSTSKKRDTKVFRFVCELKEEVIPEQLQAALDQTMELFPMYRSVIKKGLFWYYFEASDQETAVKEEDSPVCGPLYDKNVKTLLFEVTYYGRRINLEVYHALSDGTGAMQFLRTLTGRYLALCHSEELKGKDTGIGYAASAGERMDDSFDKYFDRDFPKNGKPKKAKHVKAHQLHGAKLPEYRIGIISGTVSVKACIEKAHEYHTSLSVFLTALYMVSIAEEMTLWEKKRRPVVITVPVNLRNYFESGSARNFFGVINVGYHFGTGDGRLEDVISKVSAYFKENLNEETMRRRMYELGSLEHNVFARFTPLAVKDFFLRIGYRYSMNEVTGSFSNMGSVKMPDALMPYIELFEVFVSTEYLQICTCSFQDILTISFSSAYVNTEVQKNFFRRLTQMGVAVVIASSQPEDVR